MSAVLLLQRQKRPVIDWSFLNATLPDALTFARASSATCFDSNGNLANAAVNAPRFDYDPVSHVLRGLLMEEQRTNVFLNSGTPVTQTISVTAQNYTLSFYGTGTIVRSGASSGTTVGVGSFPNRTSATFTPSAGSLTLTVSGDVQFAQLEAGSYATSYVPAGGVAATRAVDSLQTSSIAWFNRNAGTILCELIPTSVGSYMQTASFDNGSTSERVSFSIPVGGGGARFDVASGGTLSVNTLSIGPMTSGVVHKMACAYAARSPIGAVSLNGAGNTGNGSGTGVFVPPSVDRFIIANRSLSAPFTGHLRRVAYWSRALTDQEIQRITQ